jgi:hypothetical protein
MLWQSQSVVPPEKDRKPPVNAEFVRRALQHFRNQSGLVHSLVKRLSMSLLATNAPILTPERQPANPFDSEIEGLVTADSKLFVPSCDIYQVMREFMEIQLAE